MRIAPAIDRIAVNVLKHQERLCVARAVTRHTGIKQCGNVRVRKARQQPRLPGKALTAVARQHIVVGQFHRGFAVEAAIAAPREPHAAHSASA